MIAVFFDKIKLWWIYCFLTISVKTEHPPTV